MKKKEKYSKQPDSQKTNHKTEAVSAKQVRAAISPVRKAARAKEVLQKRRKQYRRVMTMARLAIRIINAIGR